MDFDVSLVNQQFLGEILAYDDSFIFSVEI